MTLVETIPTERLSLFSENTAIEKRTLNVFNELWGEKKTFKMSAYSYSVEVINRV